MRSRLPALFEGHGQPCPQGLQRFSLSPKPVDLLTSPTVLQSHELAARGRPPPVGDKAQGERWHFRFRSEGCSSMKFNSLCLKAPHYRTEMKQGLIKQKLRVRHTRPSAGGGHLGLPGPLSFGWTPQHVFLLRALPSVPRRRVWGQGLGGGAVSLCVELPPCRTLHF